MGVFRKSIHLLEQHGNSPIQDESVKHIHEIFLFGKEKETLDILSNVLPEFEI